MNSASFSSPLPSLFARLRVRLLVLVLIAILPALGLVLYDALQRQEEALKDAKAEALRIARLAASNQRQHVEASRQLLVTLAQLREVRRGQAAACEALFTNLLPLHRLYANLGLIDRDGFLIASALSGTNRVYFGDRSFFQRARDTLKFAVGEYQVGPISSKASLNLAYPVRERSGGELIGVIYAALDLTWLSHLVTRADLPENSTLAVLDRNGTLLVRQPDRERKWTGESVAKVPGVMKMIQDNREVTGQGRGIDGVARLYASTPLTRTEGLADAWVTVGIPMGAAMGPARLAMVENLFFLGSVALLALAAAWFGGDFFVLRHLNSLVAAARRLSAGDLRARTGAKYDSGEVSQLARAFDEMAETLERRVAERQRAEAELRSLNEQLEQRVAERTTELKRSNEDLEQFAYVASHDLQEPLRMVTSYLQLLEQRHAAQLDPGAQEFVGFALDGAKRMQALILDLLAYSRVGTQAWMEPVDCNQILDRALHNLKVVLDESAAEIVREPLPTLLGDPVLLTQLFQNLIGNAIKFRSAQPPVIRVRAERKGNQWQLSIQDNGIGIAPQDFDRIFVIFQRLHRRDKYPGTGIGLALCKKIVERHGGRIWVESALNRGTTFHFTLPAPS